MGKHDDPKDTPKPGGPESDGKAPNVPKPPDPGRHEKPDDDGKK
jgi:hypothetical protein